MLYNKKNAIIILSVVLAGGIIFYFFSAPKTSFNSNNSNNKPLEEINEVKSQPQHLIVYENLKFNPAILTVKEGETVEFKNLGSFPMWPASNPHPVHNNYSEFDPKKGYVKDESYIFTFTKKGVWSYHNHLNPESIGKIIVE